MTLIDTYGKTDDYSLLTNEMYAIQRNDFDGNITININVDNFHLSQTFDGFKQANSQSHELDASKVAFNIIASELSNAKINNILVANGFSQNIINDSSFDIKNIDDITGSALITATNGPLSNTSYKIINLQPYYIRLKDNIPKKYLIGKPSDIDIGVLKERYLDISNEFWSRNQEKLSFSLDPNNNTKTLTVHVTYYEDLNNKFVKLDLNISFTNKTNNLLIILLASVMSVLLLACVFVLVHKKLKKRKHVSLD